MNKYLRAFLIGTGYFSLIMAAITLMIFDPLQVAIALLIILLLAVWGFLVCLFL